MGINSFTADSMGYDDRNYDLLLAILTEGSARLDVLQTAVTDLCHLCETEDVKSQQVLEVLERHGAITKAAYSPYVAA